MPCARDGAVRLGLQEPPEPPGETRLALEEEPGGGAGSGDIGGIDLEPAPAERDARASQPAVQIRRPAQGRTERCFRRHPVDPALVVEPLDEHVRLQRQGARHRAGPLGQRPTMGEDPQALGDNKIAAAPELVALAARTVRQDHHRHRHCQRQQSRSMQPERPGPSGRSPRPVHQR